jgi:Ras-related protein Rab-8A
MGILLVYDVTDERSFNSECLPPLLWRVAPCQPSLPDIRTWHANIEQHASEGVNKILIGNKSDWTDKRAVTVDQGRELANELAVKFMETSAKVNDGVEEAFFTLARSVPTSTTISTRFPIQYILCRDCKTRLIDSQADAAGSPGGPGNTDGSVKVNQPALQITGGCCS